MILYWLFIYIQKLSKQNTKGITKHEQPFSTYTKLLLHYYVISHFCFPIASSSNFLKLYLVIILLEKKPSIILLEKNSTTFTSYKWSHYVHWDNIDTTESERDKNLNIILRLKR